MGFKVICQLKKKPLEGLANVQEVFLNHSFGDRFTIAVLRTSIQIICCYYIRIVRQVTRLLLSNLCENIVKKSIWKFICAFPNQVLNFLYILTEHGKIIADYTKKHRKNFTSAFGDCYCRATIIFCNKLQMTSVVLKSDTHN